MGKINYRRKNLNIKIYSRKGKLFSSMYLDGEKKIEFELPDNVKEDLFALSPGQNIRNIDDIFNFNELASRVNKLQNYEDTDGNNLSFPRCTIDIKDSKLSGLEWEKSLFQSLSSVLQNSGKSSKISPPNSPKSFNKKIQVNPPKTSLDQFDWSEKDLPKPDISRLKSFFSTLTIPVPLVRTYETIPSPQVDSYTLPIQIVQIKDPESESIADSIYKLIGYRKKEFQEKKSEIEKIVRISVFSWKNPEINKLLLESPRIDILHLSNTPNLGDRSFILSESYPNNLGTLGWFTRISFQQQIKLIVIHNRRKKNPQTNGVTFQLADAILNKGGPAVLVGDNHTKLISFYGGIIHDFPLDKAMNYSQNPENFNSNTVLFAGKGREDALRISTLGENLIQIGKNLDSLSSTLELGDINFIKNEIGSLEENWGTYHFNVSENAGVKPLAHLISRLRNKLSIKSPVVSRDLGGKKSESDSNKNRFLNYGFWRGNKLWNLVRVDQDKENLFPDKTYQLGIDIGIEDNHEFSFGSLPIVEELFNWEPDMKGIWIEIGISGIDFDILGDPVKELWATKSWEFATSFLFSTPC